MIALALTMAVGLNNFVTDGGDAPGDGLILAKLPKSVRPQLPIVIVKTYVSMTCVQAKGDAGPIWTIVRRWECAVYPTALVIPPAGRVPKVKHYVVYMNTTLHLGDILPQAAFSPSRTRY